MARARAKAANFATCTNPDAGESVANFPALLNGTVIPEGAMRRPWR
jgi:hypothetical protein